MKITVYCENPEDAAYVKAVASLTEDAEIALLPAAGCARTLKTKAVGTLVYFDPAVISEEKILEFGSRTKDPWGVLDRRGVISDPAALFHAGAADYVGPALYKKMPVLTAERMNRVKVLAEIRARGETAACESTNIGAPTDKPIFPPFPGWEKLKTETCYPFTFVFAALGQQKELLGHLGEKRLDKLRGDFAQLIDAWAEEQGGKLWIREASSNLVLFPAADEKATPILHLIKLQLNRALIGYENFRIELPIRFRFAVHQGDAPWRRPGSTGTVVSEHINFIYHLGMKAVDDGTIGVSDKAFRLIPEEFADFFKDGPSFEDHGVRHSRMFR
ncbi:MAG: hypothetical protein WCT14_08225 [Treponemataceae bacterium]